MSSERHAAQFLVSGRVQGVGYRMWTIAKARQLGLEGWVRNLFDGRVEIHAQGELQALDQLETACAIGPPSADVRDVTRRPQAASKLSGFEYVASAAAPEPKV